MKKLLIETYGCQMNVADSEVVASVMGMAGYELCQDMDQADAVFLNTCSVRDNAEQKILSRLEFLHSLQKKGRRIIIGVLGCMAERVKEQQLRLRRERAGDFEAALGAIRQVLRLLVRMAFEVENLEKLASIFFNALFFTEIAAEAQHGFQ